MPMSYSHVDAYACLHVYTYLFKHVYKCGLQNIWTRDNNADESTSPSTTLDGTPSKALLAKANSSIEVLLV